MKVPLYLLGWCVNMINFIQLFILLELIAIDISLLYIFYELRKEGKKNESKIQSKSTQTLSRK